MPRKPVRDWFVSTEAADMIGVSKARINVMVRTGLFPNTETPRGINLLYRADIDRVKKAKELGLFARGRPTDEKPFLNYREMCRAISECQRGDTAK